MGHCKLCGGHEELFVTPPRDNSSHVWGLMQCPVCTDQEFPDDAEYFQSWDQEGQFDDGALFQNQPKTTAEEAAEMT